jgi:RNA 2',3'-cyclic 3'-phosphodiesterase
VRLFVALDLPDEIRRALEDLIARLRPQAKEARWVRPESMHITLKFIGWAKEEQLDAIRRALEPVHSTEPVEMHFRGLGFFPNERRPRVLWCGVEASGNLGDLASQIDRALHPIGVAPEPRAFVPHLTLARFNSPRGLVKLVESSALLASAGFGYARETEFHLYESILHRSGAEYKKIASFLFAGKQPLKGRS